MTITNTWGTEIDFTAAATLMDDEIREEIAGTVDTEQEFFDAYCKAHEEKYGEEFELAKANPVY